MTKVYDQAYFDRWYRGRGKIHQHGEVRRKVMLAVSVAEYFLRRPIETVLDVGAGEGAWSTHLRAIRRKADYIGIEPSDYAIERFGKSRNLRKGSFADIGRLKGEFDLVICSDVMHYLSEKEIRAGIPHLSRLTGGLAFIEVLTEEDSIIGDLHDLIRRPAEWYRGVFRRAGLQQVGPYCWLSPTLRDDAAELEVASITRR